MRSSKRSGGGWRLALVATESVAPLSALDCLDGAERHVHDARRLASRRGRWLAGRLAIKYLVLETLEGDSAVVAGGPRPKVLSRETLQRFDAATYRAIGTVSDGASSRARKCLASGVAAVPIRPSAGGPQLRSVGGRALPWTASISHAGGWTVACLATSGSCGVDLEVVASRRAAFRRGTFTERERIWAGDPAETARSRRGRADQRFTVLWTLKESVLKAGAMPVSTLWDLPRLDLRLPDPPDLDSADGFGRCSRLDGWAEVDRRGARRMAASVSAGRAMPPSLGDVILSAVTF